MSSFFRFLVNCLDTDASAFLVTDHARTSLETVNVSVKINDWMDIPHDPLSQFAGGGTLSFCGVAQERALTLPLLCSRLDRVDVPSQHDRLDSSRCLPTLKRCGRSR